MRIQKNEGIKKDKWRTLLLDSPYSSPFQTPDYYNFYNSLEGLSADVFAVDEDNSITSLAIVTVQKERGIKAYFSKRGILYGGPLVKDQHYDSLRFLLEHISNYYSGKLIYLEIRNFFDYSKYSNAISESGFIFRSWLNFHLEISSPEKMLKSMSSSRSRQIKKAKKSGVIWKVAERISDIEEFYSILKNLYDTKIRKPLFPLSFFIEFFTQTMGKYLLVYYNEKVIGGIMCPIQHNNTIYEYYVCGLDLEYKYQYPSVMATWAAMEFASQNSINLFDFMGAGSPDEDYGVREFKARFGGKLVAHGRCINILNPLLYKIGKIGLSILSKS